MSTKQAMESILRCCQCCALQPLIDKFCCSILNSDPITWLCNAILELARLSAGCIVFIPISSLITFTLIDPLILIVLVFATVPLWIFLDYTPFRALHRKCCPSFWCNLSWWWPLSLAAAECVQYCHIFKNHFLKTTSLTNSK